MTEFNIKAGAIKGLDPATLYFLVYLINKVKKADTPGTVPLKRGQIKWETTKAMQDLQWSGFTERELALCLKKLEYDKLILIDEMPEATVISVSDEIFAKGDGPEVVTETDTEAKAREVWEYHRSLHPRARKEVNKASNAWKRLVTTIKKGYGVEELKAACYGNAKDPWWAKKNMHSLDYVLREAHLDKWVDQGRVKLALKIDSNDDIFDVGIEEGKRDDRGGQDEVHPDARGGGGEF